MELHLNNPEAGPETSQENWIAEKEKTGWKYGPKKDPEKKEHPYMVPFEELSPEQKSKDFIFKGVIEALRIHYYSEDNETEEQK